MTILSAIILLGILIFVHELGHFIFAKLMGVGVLKFSLGFGPKIVGRKIGETEYQISSVPLGGYVKMIGEEIGDEFPESEKERAFQFQPVWKRALIVLAGPTFNVLLTYCIYTVVLAAHVPVNIPNVSSLVPVVKNVAQETPAAGAGLKPGDRILKIGDRSIETRNQVEQIIGENPGKPLDLTIQRGDHVVDLTIVPKQVEINIDEKTITIGLLGIESYSPVIGQVIPGTPAAKSGLKSDDRILQINGKEIDTWFDMLNRVKKNPGKELVFTVMRGEQTLEIPVTPEAVRSRVPGEEPVGKIGVSMLYANSIQTIESSSFGEALYKGAVATYKMGTFIFDSITLLFSGQVSLKNIGGPVTIVRASGEAAAEGILPYFLFMALFSVNLGILNLLPIPILDGGHLLFFAIERIKGGPLNEKAVGILNRIGLALLIALMLLAFYNDIMRLFTGR